MRFRERPVVLTMSFFGRPEHGGAYVHKRNMLRALARLKSDSITVFVICDSRTNAEIAEQCGLATRVVRTAMVRRLAGVMLSRRSLRIILGPRLRHLPFGIDRLLAKLKTDIALFVADDPRALQVFSHNFVIQLWDLCHLEYPEFPEVSHHGMFERREYLNQTLLPKASAIIVDSEFGRKLVASAYGVQQSRIYATPFLFDSQFGDFKYSEALAEEIALRYHLSTPYIFYPAQFWPHKNHRYILRALRILADRGGKVPQVVFAGSDQGALGSIRQLATDLRLTQHLNVPGFVPTDHMPYLYKGCLALVMPTYFGPTNLPPLEARALGVPVFYSDLPAFREQMGDDAHYIDLEDPASLANQLEHLMATGASTPTRCTPPSDDPIRAYADILRQIVSRYVQRL